MPKVNYGRDARLEKLEKEILLTINHCMNAFGLNSTDMATKLHMSKSTLNTRKKRPRELTLRELAEIYKMLNVEFKLPQVVIGGENSVTKDN